jgi:hypothetical protein
VFSARILENPVQYKVKHVNLFLGYKDNVLCMERHLMLSSNYLIFDIKPGHNVYRKLEDSMSVRKGNRQNPINNDVNDYYVLMPIFVRSKQKTWTDPVPET